MVGFEGLIFHPVKKPKDFMQLDLHVDLIAMPKHTEGLIDRMLLHLPGPGTWTTVELISPIQLHGHSHDGKRVTVL